MKKVYCSGCASYFASDTMFDTHRMGDFNGVGKNRRRCMTPAEMGGKGWIQSELPVTHYIDGSPKELLKLVWITQARLDDRVKKAQRLKTKSQLE